MIRALALLLLTAPAFARPQLDSDHMKQLDRYDVLSFGDPFKNGFEMGKAIGVFDATPEEVFRVVTDYNRWKEYMPRVRASEVRDKKRDGATVEITLDLPWPVGKTEVTAKYHHEKQKGGSFKVSFAKLKGNLKQYLGTMYIEPWSPGKSAVTYQVMAQPELLAPKSMINRSLQKTASGFVNALRQRVNDLHKFGLLHPELPAQKAQSPLVGKPPAERDLQAEATH
jgi:ribosome-associated toxin RatA of RatAB toxin-antitoxin module